MFGRGKRKQREKSEIGSIALMPGGLADMFLASLFINILALAMPMTLP